MANTETIRTARDALIHELLGDVGKLDMAIKALPQEINGQVAATIKNIELIIAKAVGDVQLALASTAKQAETLTTEQLNAKIDNHAAHVVEHLRKQLLPITELTAPIEKMRKNVEFIATMTSTRKPSIWPLVSTGAVSCILAFIASGFGTILANKQEIQARDKLIIRQGQAIIAVFESLPKRERDKAEAVYQKIYTAD